MFSHKIWVSKKERLKMNTDIELRNIHSQDKQCWWPIPEYNSEENYSHLGKEDYEY